jgi:hypothetical protein
MMSKWILIAGVFVAGVVATLAWLWWELMKIPPIPFH